MRVVAVWRDWILERRMLGFNFAWALLQDGFDEGGGYIDRKLISQIALSGERGWLVGLLIHHSVDTLHATILGALSYHNL